MLTQLALVIVLIGAAVAVVLWLARPRHCTHPGVQFERSSGLLECERCGELVEWQDMQA